MSFDFYFRISINQFDIALTPAEFRIEKDDHGWASTILRLPIYKGYYDNYSPYKIPQSLYDYHSHFLWILKAWEKSDNQVQLGDNPEFDPIPF